MTTQSTADVTDPLSFYLDKSDPGAWKAVGGLAAAAKRSAEQAGLDDQRRGLVSAWREAEQVYSELERAALELAEAVTQLPELEELQVAQLSSSAVLSPEQYSAVQWLAITMNVTNRISILSHHPVRAAAQKPGSPA